MPTDGRLLERARRSAGLTQDELARRAHTSRPTLSAYERGRKSPTLATTIRLLTAAGHVLETRQSIEFVERLTRRGRPIAVPTALPRLPLHRAMATVDLPLHLSWSGQRSRVRLADRRQRARTYEAVLREGGPGDLLALVDGALLLDLWDELVLPPDVRGAWAPVIRTALAEATSG